MIEGFSSGNVLTQYLTVCAKLAGEPSLSRVELFTQNAYFAFQVIQLFLITTLSSAATAVAKQIIDSPMDAPAILANKLPRASTVYISYFIVQGLTIATGVLTQVVGFFVFTLLYKFLANTPRAMYNKWANLSAISWGSTLPVYTNIVVIGGYSPGLTTGHVLTGISYRLLWHCAPGAWLGHHRHVLVLSRLALQCLFRH